MSALSDVANYYDAPRGLSAAVGVAPRTTEEDENANAAMAAQTSGPFSQGLARGMAGLNSGFRNYAGGALESAGYDDAAKEQYAKAHRASQLGGLESSDVPAWKDVNDVGSFGRFAVGNAGAMLPMMAPALGAGGLAAAARLNPVSRFVATAAPMHPLMAGGAMERMNADPVTAQLPAGERFNTANKEGVGAAALYSTVPWLMQGRAAGLGAAVPKPALTPTGALGSIAGETAAGTVGMGASNVAAGELGRAVQRSYNPAYQAPGGDAEARKEEFMSGIGFAPVALPHAVMARVADVARAGVGAVKDLGLSAIDKIAKAAKESPQPEHAEQAADEMRAAQQEYAAAQQELTNDPQNAALQQNVAKAADKVTQVAATAGVIGLDIWRGLAKSLGMKLPEDAPEPVLYNAIANFFDRKYSDLAARGGNSVKQAVDAGMLKLTNWLGTADMTAAEQERLKPLVDKWTAKIDLSPTESRAALQAAALVSKGMIQRDHLVSMLDSINPKTEAPAGAQPSKEGAPSFEAVKKERLDRIAAKEQDTTGEEKKGPSAYFTHQVGDIVDGLVKNHPVYDTPETRALVVDSLTSFIHNLAAGNTADTGASYTQRAQTFSKTLRKAFGDAAAPAIDRLLALGESEHGAGRLERLREGEANLSTAASQLRPLLGKTGENFASDAKQGGVATLMTRMHDRISNALAADSKPVDPTYVTQLQARARKAFDAGNITRADELTAKAETERKRTPNQEMDKVRADWISSGIVKDAAAFEQAVSVVQRAHGTERAKTAKEKNQSGNASTKVQFADEDTTRPGYNQDLANSLGHDAATEMANSREGETGTHGVTGPAKYYGTGTFDTSKAGWSKRATGASLSTYPGGDYAHETHGPGTEYHAARERAILESGFKIANADPVKVQEWAKDLAGGDKAKEHELLQDAMDNLLAHDKQRLETNKNLNEGDRKAIAIRQDMGERGVAPEAFFEHPWTQHQRYLKITQHEGENLAFTPESLAASSVQHSAFYARGGETTKQYAERMAGREGSDAKAVTDALIPVRTEKGLLQVDAARLTDSTMRRHQDADTSGVMDGSRAEAVLAAFKEVVAAIMTTEGVSEKNPMGRMTDGAFDRNLVIHREGKEAWTYGELTDMARHKTAEQGLVKAPRTAEDMSAFVTPMFKAGAKARHEANPKALQTDVKSKAGEVQGQALEGKLVGGVTMPDGKRQTFNIRHLLIDMMTRNGHEDAATAVREGFIPEAYASRMIADGIAAMKRVGMTLAEGARLDNTVVFTREFANGEKEHVTWGDLKGKLQDTAVNYETAKAMEAQQKLTALEAVHDKATAAFKNLKTVAAQEGETGSLEGTPRWNKLKREMDLATTALDKAMVRAEWANQGFSEHRVGDNRRLQDRPEGSEVPAGTSVADVAGMFPRDKASESLGGAKTREHLALDEDRSVAGYTEKIRAAGETLRQLQVAREKQTEGMKDFKSESTSPYDIQKPLVAEGLPPTLENPQTAPGTVEPAGTTKRVLGPTDEAAQLAKQTLDSAKLARESALAAAEKEPTQPEVKPVVKPEEMQAPRSVTRSVQERLNVLRALEKRQTIREAAAMAEGLSPAEKAEMLDGLQGETGPAALQMASKLEGQGVKPPKLDTSDVNFSKMGSTEDVGHAVEHYQAEADRLFGPGLKIETPENLHAGNERASGAYVARVKAEAALPKTATKEAKAAVQAQTARALIDATIGGMHTLHHEGWHHVEAMLGEMGEHGQHIIDTITKGMSTPMMDAWLRRNLAEHGGALEQLSDPKERNAFGFQMFMKHDGVMPAPEGVRNFFQKIADWFKGMVGIQSNEKLTEHFFKYIKEEGFARDFDNPESVIRGMNELSGDKALRTLKESIEPLREIGKHLFTDGETRIRAHGVEAYNELADRWSGARGKAGYQNNMRGESQKWGNTFAELFRGIPHVERTLQTKGVPEAIRGFLKYMKDAGVPDEQVAHLQGNVDGYNTKLINDGNFKALVNDIVNHGNLPEGDKPGQARDIATALADLGYFYDKDIDLFAGRPDIKAKWTSKDQQDQLVSMVRQGAKLAERTRFFGETSKEHPYGEEFSRLMAEGDAKASGEAKQDMKEWIDGWEGNLGKNMSDGMRTLMSSIQTFENMRLLTTAIFSQVLEPMQLAFRKNSFDGMMGTLFRGVKELPRAFEAFHNYTPDYWEKLAMDVGTAGSRLLEGSVASMASGMAMRGKIKWLNDKFFQYNFMEGWNRSMHIEATKHGVEFIKEHAAAINGKHSERFLKELGLTKGDVTVTDGKLDLTPKDKSPEEAARVMRVERGIRQFVNEAMAHPDANSNPFWMNDPRWALVSQMKRFTFAHSKYVLQRGKDEWKQGNVWVAAPAVLAMPWMLAGDAIRDTVLMKDAPAKSLSDYAIRGFERAGHGGKSQFLSDIYADIGRGGNGLEPIGGPASQTFGDVMRVTRGYASASAIFGSGTSGGPSTE